MKFLTKFISVSILLLFYPQQIHSQQSFWVPQVSGTTAQLEKVHFANSYTGIAAGYNVLLRTSNGGFNWVQLNTGISNGYDAVKFKDPNIVYVFAYSTLYKSTNSGFNWSSVLNTGTSASDIYLFGDTIVVPGFTATFCSTNNGDTWSSNAAPPGGSYSFFFLNSKTGWSIGAQYYPPPNPNMNIYNRMYSTVDGGANWTLLSNQTSQGQPMYESIKFCNENTGYIGGLYGSRKSVNAGLNWTIIKPEYCWEVFPLNKDTLWLTSISSSLYVSTNGGANWSYDSVGVRLNDIFFLDKITGWAVGDGGKIFVSRDALIGINTSGESVPGEFMLFQNYPNPFNPVTRIRYSISSNNSEVSLEIFDISGKKVRALVNRTQNEGSYEISFDAAGLSSGVFFYRLLVDQRISFVRKMMLIK